MLKIRRLCKEIKIARKVYFIAKNKTNNNQNPNQSKPNQIKKKKTQPATDNCKFITLYKHFCRNFTEQNSQTKLESWVSVSTVCKHLLTGMETAEYNSMFKEILTELQAVFPYRLSFMISTLGDNGKKHEKSFLCAVVLRKTNTAKMTFRHSFPNSPTD